MGERPVSSAWPRGRRWGGRWLGEAMAGKGPLLFVLSLPGPQLTSLGWGNSRQEEPRSWLWPPCGPLAFWLVSAPQA